MKIKKTVFALVLALTCFSSAAMGYVVSNTNFDMFGYPSFSDKSFKPIKPHSKDSNMTKAYGDQIRNYINDARKYISAADSDIRQIEEKKREAHMLLRIAVEEYDNFINGNNNGGNNHRPGRPR